MTEIMLYTVSGAVFNANLEQSFDDFVEEFFSADVYKVDGQVFYTDNVERVEKV